MNDKPSALYPDCADAQGCHRQRLDDGGVARHRRAQGHSRRRTRQACRRGEEDRREQGIQRLHGRRGFGVIYAGPEDFGKFMAKSDTELGATMKAVGIAKYALRRIAHSRGAT